MSEGYIPVMSQKIPRMSVTAGFQTLTLDPSPRLRAHTKKVSRTNAAAEAWRQTNQALAAGIRSIKPSSK